MSRELPDWIAPLACIGGPVLVVGLLCGASAWASAYFEAAAYKRVTGQEVSVWDAVFLDLRVQEGGGEVTIQELSTKFLRHSESANARRWALLEAIRERLGFPDFFDAREAEARCLTFLEAGQNVVQAETKQHAAVTYARELLAENERLKARVAELEGGAVKEVAK